MLQTILYYAHHVTYFRCLSIEFIKDKLKVGIDYVTNHFVSTIKNKLVKHKTDEVNFIGAVSRTSYGTRTWACAFLMSLNWTTSTSCLRTTTTASLKESWVLSFIYGWNKNIFKLNDEKCFFLELKFMHLKFYFVYFELCALHCSVDHLKFFANWNS